MKAQPLTLQAGPSAAQFTQKSATAAGNISMSMVAQELLEEGLFGNVSNVTSGRASPMGSALQASSPPGQQAPRLGAMAAQGQVLLWHLSGSTF